MLNGWNRQEIAGKSIDVFEPSTAPRGVVLFLHPVGEELPSENAAYTAAFSAQNLAVAAPHGAKSWWADRICPDFDEAITAERHLLDNVLPWMTQRWGTRPLGAMGISMGGQGAVRLGFKYPKVFPVVASVAGAFDYHDWWGRGTPIDVMYASREACRRDTAILQLNPLDFPPHIHLACDPADVEWFRGNDRLHEKLTAFGVSHTVDFESSHGGHVWPYFDFQAGPVTEFVADMLTKESRRLV